MQAAGAGRERAHGAIGRLFAVAEAYPQLRATENFQQLQAQLADDRAEDRRLAADLQRHGAHVQQRHADGALERDRRASSTSSPSEFFEIEDAAREAPQVQLLTRAAVALAACLAALALAPGASAKVVHAPGRRRHVQVEPDGALRVDRAASRSRSTGDFSGAYREVPLRAARAIDRVSVAEGGQRSTGRARPRSSAASARRERSASRPPTRACGSSGTTGPRRAADVRGALPRSAGWPSPTTTWWT